MAFRDLREFSEGRHIDLPINGTTYRIEDVDAHTGLLIQRLMDAGIRAGQGGGELDLDDELLDDAAEMRTFESVLGDAYAQMIEDGVGWADLKRAAITTMMWIYFDEATAEKFWESGDAGEAAAPETGRPPSGANRAVRRASVATARTTRKRASGTGTRASTSTAKKTAARSRGANSSSNGS